MKPIVRPKAGAPATKILILRPAREIRSVRRADELDRAPMRLAFGAAATIGVVGLVWLMGHLGYRLGFAPLVDVPQLLGEPGGGLATGTVMLISLPQMILLAGGAEVGWLLLGFLAIGVPAAGLSAARPRSPGGPRPTPVAQWFSHAGAICAALNAFAMIWWATSSARNGRIAGLPLDPDLAGRWLADLQTVAGLDALGVIASALWVVLVLRLAIPLWLRALTASAALFTLVVVTVALSMSSASAALVQSPRSEVFLDDGSFDTRLVLGFTHGQVATLRVTDGVSVVELLDRSASMTVFRRQSIVGMLEQAAEDRRNRREIQRPP